MIIGFYPPEEPSRVEDDRGMSEGIAHLQFALEDVARCLHDASAVVRLELTRSLKLVDDKREETIALPREWPGAVGALLARPGARPRVVHAAAGPSSLGILLPEVAAEYFDAPACREAK